MEGLESVPKFLFEQAGVLIFFRWKFHLWELGKKLEKASRMEKKMEPPPPLKELSPANLKVLYSYGEVLGDEYWDVW